MLQAWKYTLPAFVVPVIFCLPPIGTGLLFEGSYRDIALITLTSGLALFALSLSATGWLMKPLGTPLRLIALAAGVALIIPDARCQVAGALLLGAIIASEWLRSTRDAQTQSRL
jgi:TRAP-type uncharacterized transport system fused permease subunit